MSTLYASKAEYFTDTTQYLSDTGTPINVTGHTTYIKIAKFYDLPSLVTIPGSVINGVQGQVRYECQPTAFAGLNVGTYFYTRYLVDATNTVVSVDNGSFVLTPAVI